MTCRNSGCFNHKRNHYFFKSTEKKSDRFQVIPVIRVTGFSLLNFYKYLISAERVQIVSVGFMIYICTVIKILDLYLLQLEELYYWRVVLDPYLILAKVNKKTHELIQADPH